MTRQHNYVATHPTFKDIKKHSKQFKTFLDTHLQKRRVKFEELYEEFKQIDPTSPDKAKAEALSYLIEFIVILFGKKYLSKDYYQGEHNTEPDLSHPNHKRDCEVRNNRSEGSNKRTVQGHLHKRPNAKEAGKKYCPYYIFISTCPITFRVREISLGYIPLSAWKADNTGRTRLSSKKKQECFTVLYEDYET